MDLPPHIGLTRERQAQLRRRVFANTAMAATWFWHVGRQRAVEPDDGHRYRLMTSITAAPCEYPPSTSRVLGQVLTMYWMWPLGVVGPVGRREEVEAGG